MKIQRRPRLRPPASATSAYAAEPARVQAAERELPAVPERDVAVIGLAARLPAAAGLDQFWQNLVAGKSSVRTFEREELLASGVPAELVDSGSYIPCSAFLDDVDQFDASFFGFSRREAEVLDPQHRLLFECAWQALEDGGYAGRAAGSRVGVFATAGMSLYSGKTMNTYFRTNVAAHADVLDQLDAIQIKVLSEREYLPTQLSYRLNLTGPSFVVNTACSSALVALHLAIQSLRQGECDAALVGASAIHAPHKCGYEHRRDSIFSADGVCRPFDDRAAGIVGGNGVGVLLLRRLPDALRDGHRVMAVVRGTAINNDGARKVSYTAPSVDGQKETIRGALADAGISAAAIGYVEAHGTGTSVGDPIEVAALTQVFADQGVNQRGSVPIGSVKSNVGHLDTAAGMASVIKAILAVERGIVPPTAGFEKINRHIAAAATPFFVNTEALPWATVSGRRHALIASLGAGGTNAHVVLANRPELAAAEPDRRDLAAHGWVCVPISAKDDAALRALAGSHAALASSELSPLDWSFSAATGRAAFRERAAVVGRSPAELAAGFAALAAGAAGAAGSGSGAFSVAGSAPRQPVRIAFALGGGDPVACGAARSHFYQRFPAFREAHDRAAAIFGEQAAGCSAAALFNFRYALCELWRSLGVVPAAILGDGPGDPVAAYVAAHVTGGVQLEQTIRDLLARRPAAPLRFPNGSAQFFAAGFKFCLQVGPRHELERPAAAAAAAAASAASQAEPGDGDRTGSGDGELDPGRSFHRALAELFAAGARIEWHALFAGQPARPRPLPTYPFQRASYWLSATPPGAAPSARASAPAHPLGMAPFWQTIDAQHAAVEPAGARWMVGVLGERDGEVVALRRLLAAAGLPADPLVDAQAARAAAEAGPLRLVLLQGGGTAARLLVDLRDWLQTVERDSARDCRVVLLTRAGHAPHAHGSLAAALAARALWGGARSAQLELAQTRVGWLDVAGEPGGELVRTGLAAASIGDELRVDGRGLAQLRLEAIRLPDGSDARAGMTAGVAVISGGLGALGRHLARHLARHAAPGVVLIGRSPPDAGARADIAALKESGARTAVVQGDAADAATWREVSRQAEEMGLPIGTVYHLAGVLKDATLHGVTLADVAAVLRPKLDAAEAICAAAATLRPERVVLFGSLAGVLGAPGQFAYSAANAALGAAAEYLRARGVPALALALPTIAGIGMAARAAAGRGHNTERVAAIDPDSAWRLLGAAIGAGAAEIAANPGVAAAAMSRPAAQIGRELFFGAPAEPASTPGAGAAPGSAAMAPAAAPGPRGPLDLAAVRRIVADLLGHPQPESVAPDATFESLGIDSLALVRLREQLEKRGGLRVSTSTLYNHPSCRELADHFATLAPAVAPEPAPASLAPPPPAPVAPPAAASDDIESVVDELLDALGIS